MRATSIGQMLVLCLAISAAIGAAVFFGIVPTRPKPPIEIAPLAAASMISPPAPVGRDEGSVATGTPPVEANAKASAFAIPLSAPKNDQSVPVFDIARIERSGDAVIAGRAAPGAIVELLRGGELYDL
jgi:hypothetical protein